MAERKSIQDPVTKKYIGVESDKITFNAAQPYTWALALIGDGPYLYLQDTRSKNFLSDSGDSSKGFVLSQDNNANSHWYLQRREVDFFVVNQSTSDQLNRTYGAEGEIWSFNPV